MMVYLVQHGEAVPKDVDPNRPLSETGQAHIRRMGEFLERHGHRPSRVFHSGKLRAAETAEILAAAFAPALASEEMEGLGAKDSPDALAETLAKWTDDVLLVSHMPIVGKLVTRLVIRNVLVQYKPADHLYPHKPLQVCKLVRQRSGIELLCQPRASGVAEQALQHALINAAFALPGGMRL